MIEEMTDFKIKAGKFILLISLTVSMKHKVGHTYKKLAADREKWREFVAALKVATRRAEGP